MKNLKRILSLVLVALLTLSLCGMAISADGTNTITISGENVKAGHTYEAYQVFAGTLNADGTTLSDITWGNGVDGAALLTALKAETAYASCTSAEDVAAVIANYADDAEALQAFAKIVGANLATVAGTSTEATAPYTITGLSDGYFLVKDKNDTVPATDAYTRYILEVLNDVTIDAKVTTPPCDKNILEGDVKVKANTANIGDKVNYVVDSEVPDMTGYNYFYYVFEDTMSKGLTYNDDIEITIGDTVLSSSDYAFSSEKKTDGRTVIKFSIKDMLDYTTGDAIVITYSATVNQDADLTSTGNVNEVELKFSNNPNYDYTPGDFPGPDDDDVLGVTPKSKTKTYVTGAKLTKVDANDNSKTLEGAKFSISGTTMNVVLINKEIYQEDAQGTFYMLRDGSYTEAAPNQYTEGKYDSTTTMYKKVTVVDKNTVSANLQTEGYADENGILTIEGLGAGTYTITEVGAPSGYNLLTSPITLVITANNVTFDSCEWSATVDGANATIEDGVILFTVENSTGATLPSTGGMGTVAIYAVGAILVLAAVVVLISKKRMHNN